ncbi:MAG: hypothetical protein HYT13_01115 [Candidatus Liptonbacteria bacterium]|nr:hypothetical protein [Candidatus Liptonbacteria bacterium]
MSNTEDTLQSVEAVARCESHVAETLSPSLTVNGFDVRAQWYGPHEWLAYVTAPIATTATSATRPAIFTREFENINLVSQQELYFSTLT